MTKNAHRASEIEPCAFERARRGDRRAFAAVVRHYDPGLRALAYRLLGDRTRMDDELQEAYVNAFRGLPRATLRPGLSASPGSPCAKRPADRHSPCHESRRQEPCRCLGFLERQLCRGLPGVYGAVISGHRESPPVQRIRHNEAPEVTGDDSSGQLPITRNEGVPGSSPGVGLLRFAGI